MGAQVTRFSEFVAQHITAPFRVIDVGCSGGIAAAWRVFGSKLHAIGFEPNFSECRRLAAAETLAVEYVAGFVGAAGGIARAGFFGAAGEIARAVGTKKCWSRNPSPRFSYERSQELRRVEIESMSDADKTSFNAWENTELADPKQVIALSEFLHARTIDDIDFVKIDVDGEDFEILRDIETDLGKRRALGVQIEINYWGSDNPNDHTLHNVDRLMKRAGFELMDLSQRRYTTRLLPGRYLIGVPAETDRGRIYQGDAVYIRDLAQPDWLDLAEDYPAEKLAKLAAIFAAYGLTDCAAEILVELRERVETFLPVDEGLDLLAAQAQGDAPDALSYAEFTARFEADDEAFYVDGKANSAAEGDVDLSNIPNPTKNQLWCKLHQLERDMRVQEEFWRARVQEVEAAWQGKKAAYEEQLAGLKMGLRTNAPGREH